MVLFTSTTYPFSADPKSDVRNAKPLMVPFTRMRLRVFQTFAGAKGTRAITHFRFVPSGISRDRKRCRVLMRDSVACGGSVFASGPYRTIKLEWLFRQEKPH